MDAPDDEQVEDIEFEDDREPWSSGPFLGLASAPSLLLLVEIIEVSAGSVNLIKNHSRLLLSGIGSDVYAVRPPKSYHRMNEACHRLETNTGKNAC